MRYPSVYVHVPFCRRKCIYCDFYSVGERLADWHSFIDKLLEEARERLPKLTGNSESTTDIIPIGNTKSSGSTESNGNNEPDNNTGCAFSEMPTLYIGGGTPSLMPADEFERLAAGLLALMPPVAEFTIEVNPDDVTEEKCEAWAHAGVTRVSMGVQSLLDSELHFIGRRHTADEAVKAFSILRRYFSNISLDLMFGLPGQTLESLQYTLSRFIELAPEHISAYSLMYEERSALTRMLNKGEIVENDEDISVKMFELINITLADAGYEQYEISNYALPGKRSIHNSRYWQSYPYIGLGPGAHSYDGNRMRQSNAPDVKGYIKGERIVNKEELREADILVEYVMTRLRTREGIDLQDFRERFGESNHRDLLKRSVSSELRGELIQTDHSLHLSRKGIMISDEIILRLI